MYDVCWLVLLKDSFRLIHAPGGQQDVINGVVFEVAVVVVATVKW